MRTQVYIINRTATSTLKNETPFQALHHLTVGHDSRPNLYHLRVLWCKVYVLNPRERRFLSYKLEARAEFGILVGYDGSHVCKIYMPSRKTVIRSSNLRFDGDGLITAPEDDVSEEPMLENLEDRGDKGVHENDDHNDDLDSNQTNGITEDDELTPFEELACGSSKLNQHHTSKDTSQPHRPGKICEPISRASQYGNSILSPPPQPDESVVFTSFLAVTTSSEDPSSLFEALSSHDENVMNQIKQSREAVKIQRY